MPHDPRTFADITSIFSGLIWLILPVLLSLSLLTFIWGLVKFIRGAGSDQDLADGKKLITWGLVALFLLLSFWAIIRFFYGDIFGGAFGFPFLPDGSSTGQ